MDGYIVGSPHCPPNWRVKGFSIAINLTWRLDFSMIENKQEMSDKIWDSDAAESMSSLLVQPAPPQVFSFPNLCNAQNHLENKLNIS